MERSERLAFLEDLAHRRVSLRDVAGLDAPALDALARLAAAAFQAARYEDAAQLFGFLESLEPDHAEHALHRGHACAALGELDDARAALERYVAREDTPHEARRQARTFLEGLS